MCTNRLKLRLVLVLLSLVAVSETVFGADARSDALRKLANYARALRKESQRFMEEYPAQLAERIAKGDKSEVARKMLFKESHDLIDIDLQSELLAHDIKSALTERTPSEWDLLFKGVDKGFVEFQNAVHQATINNVIRKKLPELESKRVAIFAPLEHADNAINREAEKPTSMNTQIITAFVFSVVFVVFVVTMLVFALRFPPSKIEARPANSIQPTSHSQSQSLMKDRQRLRRSLQSARDELALARQRATTFEELSTRSWRAVVQACRALHTDVSLETPVLDHDPFWEWEKKHPAEWTDREAFDRWLFHICPWVRSTSTVWAGSAGHYDFAPFLKNAVGKFVNRDGIELTWVTDPDGSMHWSSEPVRESDIENEDQKMLRMQLRAKDWLDVIDRLLEIIDQMPTEENLALSSLNIQANNQSIESLDIEKRQFKVALSFPGEKRAFVEKVAKSLATVIGEEFTLYDKYHEHIFARLDLDVYLPALYREHSELIVLFLCPEYAIKHWCNLEWRHIRQLISTDAVERIMPLAFGDPGDLSKLGFLSGDGYLDIGDRGPEDIATLILKRLEHDRLVASQPSISEKRDEPSGLTTPNGSIKYSP